MNTVHLQGELDSILLSSFDSSRLLNRSGGNEASERVAGSRVRTRRNEGDLYYRNVYVKGMQK